MEAKPLLKHFWILFGYLMLLLTFLRFVFWGEFATQFEPISITQQALSYLVGLRFDLMVCAYAMAPFLLFALVVKASKLKLNRSMPYALMGWFIVVAIFLMVLQTADSNSVRSAGNRFFSDGLKQKGFFEYLSFSGPIKFAFFSFVGGLFTIAGGLRKTAKPEDTSADEIKSYVVSLLLLVLLARGSLGAHHLDLRHANISENKFTELMSLNSAYCLDQALRGRR